jgi:hypothetical protein
MSRLVVVGSVAIMNSAELVPSSTNTDSGTKASPVREPESVTQIPDSGAAALN